MNILEESLVGMPFSQQVTHGFGITSHGPHQAMSFMCIPQAIEEVVMDSFVGKPARRADWGVGFADLVQEAVEQNMSCTQLHENAHLSPCEVICHHQK